MFYQPDARDRTALPHDPFKAIVAPRPIGWISTVSAAGKVNLAPYSFFNAVSANPPMVLFSSEGAKHSAGNAEATGEFVCSLATYALKDQMNASSAPLPEGESEFAFTGLTPAASRFVKPPRVADSPAALECKVIQVVRPVRLDGATADNVIVIGQVVGIHIDDAYIVDGRFDLIKAGTITRAGYMDYVRADAIFAMARPAGGGGTQA
ncbi:MAG: flavin reductase family protein [Ancalomicrobiaceae bacterium]|nr:flavin reductase family protein [Ancalomicrobiaceae bacterium]